MQPTDWPHAWARYYAARVGFPEDALAGLDGQAKAAAETKLVEAAQLDCNIFNHVVLRNKAGDRVRQHAVHYFIQRHIDWCWERGYHSGILAPWGHGKTEQVLGRTLQCVGQNPEIRAKIVCAIDKSARDRAGSMRSYLHHSDDLHRIFPHLRLDEARERSKHRILLERASHSKDATIEAWGLASEGIGGRSDLLVFDDPIGEKSALSKADRETAKERFYNTWMGRLEEGGRALLIATSWHSDDLTAELRREREQWVFLVIEVNDDESALLCHNEGTGQRWTCPLWEPQWSTENLRKQKASMSPTAWARGFKQQPLAAEDKVFDMADFRWFERASWDPLSRSLMHPDDGRVNVTLWQAYDLAISRKESADYFAGITVASDSRGNIYILHIWRARLRGPLQRDAIIAGYNDWDPAMVGIESNAYQDALRHFVLEKARVPVKKLRPVTDKRTRFEKAALQIAGGKVFLPGRLSPAGWVIDLDLVPGGKAFQEELSTCTGLGEGHDDQCDALAYVLEMARSPYRPQAQSLSGV